MIGGIVDLSHWKPITDSAAMKAAGVIAVITKATQGTTWTDELFYAHRVLCDGLLFGAFHYGTVGQPVEQADHFLKVAHDGKTLLALDLESGMSIADAEQFVQRVHDVTGRWPVLYTRADYIQSRIGANPTLLSNCPLWVASYREAPDLPQQWATWTLWQYTNGTDGPAPKGFVPGINKGRTLVDRNLFNGSLTELQAFWASGTGVTQPVVDRFDSPVGTEAERDSATIYPGGWKTATPFLAGATDGYELGRHTGHDLNLNVPKYDTDAHAPVYSIGDGIVTYVDPLVANETDWFGLIVIKHTLTDGSIAWSRYGHVENALVRKGDIVRRGQQIAQIGNAKGKYLYHLHFEIAPGKDNILGVNPRYWPAYKVLTDEQVIAAVKKNFVDPQQWLQAHHTGVVVQPITYRTVFATDNLVERVQPLKTATKLKTIPKGTKVQEVVAEAVNGYARLSDGYALDAFLCPVGGSATMYCTATSGLNVRQSPDKNAPRVGSLRYQESVQVSDVQNNFARIPAGYAYLDYLDTDKPADLPVTPPVTPAPVSKTQTIGIHYMPGGNDAWMMGLLQDVKKAGKLPLFIKLVKMAGGFSNGLSVQQVKSVWADCVVMVRYYDDSWEQHVNASLARGWNAPDLTHEGTILCRDYLARFYNVDPDYRAADYQQILCEPIVGKGTPSFWLGAMAESEKVGARLAVLCNPMGWPPLPSENTRPDTLPVYDFWQWPDTLTMVERVIAGGHCLMFDEYIYPDIGDTTYEKSGWDAVASVNEYLRRVEAAVKAEYPDAEIEVIRTDYREHVDIDSDDDDYNAEADQDIIRDIIHNVWESWEWLVNDKKTTESPAVAVNKKPVYTISLEDIGWVSNNLEQPGNGRITMGAPEATIEATAGKNTLFVSVHRCVPGVFGEDCPYEVIEVQNAYLETLDGEEFAPADLVDRIEIEGYRRVWSGAYVATEDLDDWMTAAEAQKRYSVASATIRQAINREIDNRGKAPNWARKSAGTWLVKRSEAEARWGKK